ncbi:MAG: CHAT domain-containing protein, partial [Marinoscillum sp.]
LDRAGLLTEGGGDVLVNATKNYNIMDGILTAHEAMNLNFENTELIVLSACETGRGEIQQGEGVFGLQRSFLVAGADAIIMSLFQVSDEVTQLLMVEFYNNWMNGQDKRTAFNNAQRTIKENYNDPIYWGAFTMIAKI